MGNFISGIKTGRWLASLFVLSGLLLTGLTFTARGAVKNSFATPDFAFPQTVGKNASLSYEKAVSASDWLTALRAAIQLDVAASQVSADSYAASLARFDSIASVAPTPYAQLALLLEARLYCDIYNSRRSLFNNRVIPLSPAPENVMEWSRPIFSAKVTELTAKAVSPAPDSSADQARTSLSVISPILSDSEDAVKAGFSVADFISMQALDLLSNFTERSVPQIPFGTGKTRPDTGKMTPDLLTSRILDDAIKRNDSGGTRFAESFFCEKKLNALQGDELAEWRDNCFKRFGDTRYGAPFVSAYAQSLPSDRERYNLLTGYLRKFPDAPRINIIQSELNSLTQRNVTLSFPERSVPAKEIPVSVTGANVYDSYILVFPLAGNDTEKSYRYADIVSRKPLHAVRVSVSGSVPDRVDTVAMIPGLKQGLYAILPSSAPSASGLFEKRENAGISPLLVTQISVLTADTPREGTENGRSLYVSSAEDGHPLPGAKVLFYPLKNGNRGVPSTVSADREGRVAIPDTRSYYRVEYDGSFADGATYSYRNGAPERKSRLSGSILTDLAIYHPGDSVRFETITYIADGHGLEAAPETGLNLYLRDANGSDVDSLNVVTDRLGRCAAAFRLPESGLLGSWSVNAYDGRKWICNRAFEVADYKSPTFYVTVDSSSDEFTPGSDLRFTGKAMTYAGMPVAGAKVAYSIEYQPLWWRSDYSSASYGGETATGADGSFSIDLPTRRLENTRFARAGYRLSVSVTDGAGETQQCQPLSFSLGKALRISADIPEMIEIGDSALNLSAHVYDLASRPVVADVYYRLERNGETVGSGEFKSPLLHLDVSSLPSAKYALKLCLDPEFRQDGDTDVLTDSIILWRGNDVRPPVQTPLWLPRREIMVPDGTSKVKVRVGSSYPGSYLLTQISDTRKVLENRWVGVKDGFAEVDVKSPRPDERVYVSFVGIHDFDIKSGTVTLIPEEQKRKLTVEALSFRDKIEPGTAESWKFRFTYAGKPCAGLPVSTVMTNKALNSIVPFSWAFNPYGSLIWSDAGSIGFRNNWNSSNSIWLPVQYKLRRETAFGLPEWNTYGYPLYAGGVWYGSVRNEMKMSAVRARGAAPTSDGMLYEESADMAMSAGVENFAVASSAPDGGSVVESGESLREVECPIAFFKPGLTADGDGIAEVAFTAPAFVGTWQFQVMGYTPEMKGAVLTLEAVAAKKVMAQLNAPRFLRTGDRASVSATLFNNSGERADVSGSIEVTDALSGAVILSREFSAQSLDASGSRTVSVEFDVPADVNALVVRAYASMPGHTDGEQTAVPVLPASEPVVESTPFYIAPDEDSFSLQLPEFRDGSHVTLTYCDNPVWECVTALPSMLRPQSVNTLARANALYGNAVAAGLFSRYPQLGKAVIRMAADSALLSPLERNESLKSVILDNTPWVNDARDESLRMQSLVEFADSGKSASSVADMMKLILDSQNPDGGWSWCPEMKSSQFITGRLLHVFASLKNMGFLPGDADAAAMKAFKFMDDEFAADWNRSDRKYIPVETLLDYLYDRSAFGSVVSTSAFKPLESAALKRIESGWRELGIARKATAAMLFRRISKSQLAHTLLESLRQYASTSREKGMWFDNLESAGSGTSSILATARALEAYAMIKPDSPAVDQLRQWLVMSKQTQNWGDDRETCEAIYALLSSGSEWTASVKAPVISVGLDSLDLGSSSVTGCYVVNLDASASGKTLTVSRSAAGPAWGGVVAQYVAPIADVKAAAIPQLSVSKNIYAVTSGESGSVAASGTYAIGDRIRVTLTLVCDRDLDYVTVTDSRAACLEPADQLSGYTSSDGVWYYREVRDARTNLFIPFLSKGTHVISYECYADRPGAYSLGIAQAQSQYAPEITAHTAGRLLRITPLPTKP